MSSDGARLAESLELIFHAACVAGRSFDDPVRIAHSADWDGVDSSTSGWKKAGGKWRLPLYDYPTGLDHGLRQFLPLCFAEWTGQAHADPLTPAAQHRSLPEKLDLAPASVTLWAPNVVLVSQRMRAGPWREGNIYALIDELAKRLYAPLQACVEQALEAASEHPMLTRLVPSIDPKVLWVVGTGFLTPGAASEDRHLDEDLRARVNESPEDVGPLRIFVKDLVTVVTPGDTYSASGREQQLKRAADDFAFLMSLQNVAWAIAIHYDRLLLRSIAEKDVDISRRRLRDVEAEGRALVSLIHVVAVFRASLGSMEIHLGREAHGYWTYLNKVWDFDGYLESLTTKVGALVQLHHEVTAAVSSRRARRLGVAAFAFTALGVVTVGLAILGFIAADVDAIKVGVFGGVLVLGVLASMAVFVFWLGLAEPGTRRPRQLGGLRRRDSPPHRM